MTADILRYVQCEIPDDVSDALIRFENDFQLAAQDIIDRLDAFGLNTAPGLIAAIDEYAALEEELLKGAPVPELSSYDALEKNLMMTNPLRQDDEFVKRQEERMLGTFGIIMLNGKVYKETLGNDIQILRNLWEAAGGDYNSFILMGNGIVAMPDGYCVVYEYNPHTKTFPLVNRRFEQLPELTGGYRASNFKTHIFWKNNIGVSVANNTKLKKVGFTDEQIASIFAGNQPNANYDFVSALESVQTNIANLARLALLPKTDALRNPPWVNETNFLELALRNYLEWRLKRSQTSNIINPDMWEQFKPNVSERNMRELFEHRPEVQNMAVPTTAEDYDKIVSDAVMKSKRSTAISTYMLGLPTPSQLDDLEEKLFWTGVLVWRHLL